MSQNSKTPGRASSDRDFDPEWYLRRYPDVAKLGMDPAEHYAWLGRRLGRSPRPSRVAPEVLPTNIRPQSAAWTAQPNYSNDDIGNALKTILNWLFPTGRAGSLSVEKIFDQISCNFWNDESSGTVKVNVNGKLAVDFVRDLDLDPRRARRRASRAGRAPQSILLASYYAPSKSHAGGLRILDVYEEIRKRHPDVRLTLFCPSHPSIDGDVSVLSDLFDEIHFCEPQDFSAETFLKRAGASAFDLVDLQFHQAGNQAEAFRSIGKRLIFTPMEVLSRFQFDFIRKLSAAGDFPIEKFFGLIHHGAEEQRIMHSVDMTVCVSDADADFLKEFAGSARVSHFPTGLSPFEFGDQLSAKYRPPAITRRKSRLVFAAYFGSETNAAGLDWYLREVHPRVLNQCPNYNLAVVGRGDTSRLEAIGAKSVSFIGEVPRLSPVLEQCKAGLVLALHGSGFRGKINQYALCGLPSISTTLGSTGLDYVDGEDIVLADGAKDFADACVAILTNASRTQRLGNQARQRAIGTYSWNALWPQVAAVYGLA